MAPLLTILITGAGSPGAPGVIKSLRYVKDRRFRLIGMDINPASSGKALVDHFFLAPRADDPDFIEKLLDLCKMEKVDVILPLVSAELPHFSRHIDRFRKIGTHISVSVVEHLEIALNKGKCFRVLEEKGFAVPHFRIVKTVESLREAIRDLGFPESPVCFKPTQGDGSRGFHILDANVNRFELLFHGKPSSAYINEQELFDILKDTHDIPETIVMEFLPNEEYSVDLLARDGEVLSAIPRLRQTIMNGISVKSMISETRDVIDYTTKIVESLGLNGNIGVQVRRGKDNMPKILEINPRIQGTIVHCTASGVNLPYLAVKLAKGLPIAEEELNVNWGTQMVRYWNEFFYEKDGTLIPF